MLSGAVGFAKRIGRRSRSTPARSHPTLAVL